MDCVIQHHDLTITHRISTLRSCSYFPTSKFYLSITFLVGFFQLPTLYPGKSIYFYATEKMLPVIICLHKGKHQLSIIPTPC